jgi:LysM repeat protein
MKNNNSMRLASLILLGILLSACTQSYSPTSLITPTLIPTGLFVVSPFPSGQDPMQLVADLGTQTALARNASPFGTPGVLSTPATIISTVSTPTTSTLPGGTLFAPLSVTPRPGTTNVPVFVTTPAPVTVIPGVSTTGATVVVPTISSVRPTTYKLQQGEFPFCLARRFNVDPDALLAASGLSSADTTNLSPGTTLTIPQTGSFPGTLAWHNHPDTYTVTSSTETVYSVACYYGDVYPETVAKSNNIALTAALTVGQKLTIP